MKPVKVLVIILLAMFSFSAVNAQVRHRKVHHKRYVKHRHVKHHRVVRH